jgi:hypothetical protein
MRVLLTLITVGITIYAFIDCLRCTDEEVRNLPRSLWMLITLVPLVGGLVWLVSGRPAAGRPGGLPTRAVAPDDDPEFLRSLDRSFRERRRQAAEEARRHRLAEETRRQTTGEQPQAPRRGDQAQRDAEAAQRDAEAARDAGPRRGGHSGGWSGNGKPANGKPANGAPGSAGPNGTSPSSAGPDGDERQTPA